MPVRNLLDLRIFGISPDKSLRPANSYKGPIFDLSKSQNEFELTSFVAIEPIWQNVFLKNFPQIYPINDRATLVTTLVVMKNITK